MAAALFAIVALVTAGSAVGVVVSKSIIRSAVWLLFTLVGVAVTYVLLGAEFLAATQLIVYVGGTLVLLVFGGMLTAGGPFTSLRTRPAEWAAGVVLAGGLFVLLANAALRWPDPSAPGELPGVGPLGLTFLGAKDPYASRADGRQFAYRCRSKSFRCTCSSSWSARRTSRGPKEGQSKKEKGKNGAQKGHHGSNVRICSLGDSAVLSIRTESRSPSNDFGPTAPFGNLDRRERRGGLSRSKSERLRL
jgi:NADH-quinone oxidoreductase subunit J